MKSWGLSSLRWAECFAADDAPAFSQMMTIVIKFLTPRPGSPHISPCHVPEKLQSRLVLHQHHLTRDVWSALRNLDSRHGGCVQSAGLQLFTFHLTHPSCDGPETHVSPARNYPAPLCCLGRMRKIDVFLAICCPAAPLAIVTRSCLNPCPPLLWED